METMKHSRKKGNFAFMQDSIVSLAVIVLVLAFTAVVLGSVDDTFTAGTYEANITTAGLDALDQFSDFLTPIALIVVIVVILGFVFLLSRRSGGGI